MKAVKELLFLFVFVALGYMLPEWTESKLIFRICAIIASLATGMILINLAGDLEDFVQKIARRRIK